MSNTRQLKIKYQKVHDFKTSFITGVHGGISGNGLLTANFFTDRIALPERQLITVDEKNSPLKVEDELNNDGVREVQFSVLMDINTSKLVVEWLNNRISEYEQLNPKKDV
jgi:hypothetical protein